MLTQNWLSTFLSIILRKFITKLHSRLPAQFPPALHKALSYLLFFLLGTVLDNKLNFNKNTDFIHIRCRSRIFCLQKLRPLNVSAAFLCTFYRSCIESVLIFLFLCWFGGLNVKSKNVLNKVVNVCGKDMGERQEHLSQLYEHRVWYGRLGWLWMTTAMSLINIMSFFHLVDDFMSLNLIQSIAFLNRCIHSNVRAVSVCGCVDYVNY